jgi:hypothetical protein
MAQSTLSRRERLLAALLLVTIVAGGCADQGRQSQTPTSTPLRHLPALSARTFWPQASALAQEWRPDAYVRDITVEVDVRLRNSSPDRRVIYFSVQSPNEDYVQLAVACDAKGCDSFEVEQKPEYPLMQCIPFALDDFTLDSGDALEIGLQRGGEKYMQLQIVSVILKLNRASPGCTGSLEWTASFADLTAIEGLDVIIDAVTGEVVEIRD